MAIAVPSDSVGSTLPFIEKTLELEQPLRLFCPTEDQKVVDLGTFTVLMHNGALRLVYQAPGNGEKYTVATLSRDKTIKVGRDPLPREPSGEFLPIKLSAGTNTERNLVSYISNEHLVVRVKDGEVSVTSVGTNGTVEGLVDVAKVVTPRVEDIAALPLSKPKPVPSDPGAAARSWFSKLFGGR